MKIKIIGAILALVAVFSVASPAVAASLGVSPTTVKLEVPGGGAVTVEFNIHYFKGDIQISLVDIPLEVEPKVIHVDSLAEPESIQLTIYGDESLGSHTYTGYIQFVGLSGDTVAVAIRPKAEINHIVTGQSLVPETAPEAIEPTAPTTEPTENKELSTEPQIEIIKQPAAEEKSTPVSPTRNANQVSLPIVIAIVAGVAVVCSTVVLLIAKRRRY